MMKNIPELLTGHLYLIGGELKSFLHKSEVIDGTKDEKPIGVFITMEGWDNLVKELSMRKEHAKKN